MPADAVVAQLARARYIPAVAKLMMPAPSGTAKDWAAYRARFVEPKRVAAGVAFWRANQAWLTQAQARWGVPPSLVVGVIGVETFYGRVTGTFRVLDALSTLSFDFPTGRRDRTPFFRAQLEAFLHWCEREGVDPPSVLGSYAGAMGWPQFMPTSIDQWAIDFDNDGRIDLSNSMADVVGSVAHYMAAHGWQRDVPTHYAVTPPTEVGDRATLLEPDILPSFSAAQMTARGATLSGAAAQSHVGRLALIELQNGASKTPTYVAGTENFYVVTRYNWSSYYAMAVIDLGASVASELNAQAMAAAPHRNGHARNATTSKPRRTVARAP